jgi:hypothetical protein
VDGDLSNCEGGEEGNDGKEVIGEVWMRSDGKMSSNLGHWLEGNGLETALGAMLKNDPG